MPLFGDGALIVVPESMKARIGYTYTVFYHTLEAEAHGSADRLQRLSLVSTS